MGKLLSCILKVSDNIIKLKELRKNNLKHISKLEVLLWQFNCLNMS